jgi:hypothetical protein
VAEDSDGFPALLPAFEHEGMNRIPINNANIMIDFFIFYVPLFYSY